ncbi:MAG: 5'/3'-nucleotidase SurE [Woeseiaceae bacterium]|jgi:5'-nucleotidase|nr:5'/3'-nucleotidase SurE [Woeseiaceae bacterium]|tara:strand:+ start:301 stop:1041 length:741 start_codon:yes stop_codon:yes gene_type:complete
MIILLSNDDGYLADGINILAAHLKKIAEIIIFAPKENHSGSSSALTLRSELQIKKIDDNIFCVNGTPADTVYLGLSGFLDIEPDMVISGVNHGANLGEDVLYSGTVAAAIEGRSLGIPSIAISSINKNNNNYKVAAQVAVELVEKLKSHPFPSDTILNVNVPDRSMGDLNGVVATRLGTRKKSYPIPVSNNESHTYNYLIGAPGEGHDAGPGTDFHAINNDSVSVSPIQIDMTNHTIIEDLRDWLI